MKSKLRKCGNSVGVVLPKKVLDRLNLVVGESVLQIENADGSFRLTAFDSRLVDKMKVAERLSRRYRHALKESAK
jgi:putative addiction module antidote